MKTTMKIVYTRHALEKFVVLEKQDWKITKNKISRTVRKPKWRGVSRFGQKTVMSLVDMEHIIRVVFDEEDGIIKVITFHIARRGKYESTL